MKRIGWLSPLPPSRTGIAHYSAMLLPELSKRTVVVPIGSPEEHDPAAYDAAVYHLGNNPHHEWIYRAALERPGVVVLHDVVLHHLIVEMTLARGDVDGYVRVMEASHGAAGAAWARGRAEVHHDEIGNFLLPASVEISERASAVVVHNRWAADRLTALGVTTPIHVVPHPVDPVSLGRGANRSAMRARLGIGETERVIGVFGFLTSAKRGEVILEAFASAGREDLKLLVVGEAAPNIDLRRFRGDRILTTGYVPDAEFDDYYAAADLLVNLRYPTAGETSGTLIRAFAAGRPVAVSDYAQFAELPRSCVTRIPLGDGEVEALARFFTADPDVATIAASQREWLDANASMDAAVDGYLAAVTAPGSRRPKISLPLLPLFPRLAVVSRSAGLVTLRNDGDAVIRSREYGRPAYRLVAKLFEGGREVEDRWLELTSDLRPGETIALPVPHRPGTELRLHHAMQGLPMHEPEAWYAAAL